MPNAGKPMDNQVKGPPRDTKPGESTSSRPMIDEKQIKGSMKTEEPLGWDQAPQAIKDPKHKRHPRPDAVGGIHPRPDKDSPLNEDEMDFPPT